MRQNALYDVSETFNRSLKETGYSDPDHPAADRLPTLSKMLASVAVTVIAAVGLLWIRRPR
jgi:hypothetical protein